MKNKYESIVFMMKQQVDTTIKVTEHLITTAPEYTEKYRSDIDGSLCILRKVLVDLENNPPSSLEAVNTTRTLIHNVVEAMPSFTGFNKERRI